MAAFFVWSELCQWGREPPEVPPLLPLLDELAEEPWEAELALALAAEKPPERELVLPPELAAPARLNAEALERDAAGGATEREAVEKLRAGAAVGRAPGFAVRNAFVEVGAAPRAAPALAPFIAPTRALVAVGALELTKRCETASYARDELAPRPMPRVAEFPPAMVRSTRTGAVVLATRALTVFVGTDFTDFHCSPAATGARLPIVPLLTAKTPRVKFCGVLLLASSGCVGTMPIGPLPFPPRSHVPVTGE